MLPFCYGEGMPWEKWGTHVEEATVADEVVDATEDVAADEDDDEEEVVVGVGAIPPSADVISPTPLVRPEPT